MLKFSRIAWRNIWRNRRRSLLTLGMLIVGLAMFIFSWSFGDGFHDEMIRNAVQTQMAHIEVHAKGFLDNPVIKTRLSGPGPRQRHRGPCPARQDPGPGQHVLLFQQRLGHGH